MTSRSDRRLSHFTVIRATPNHARELAPILREADKRECAMLHSESPEAVLLASIEVSDEAWAVMLAKRCVGLFGHRDIGEQSGIIWLVGSDELTNDRKRFARAVREWFPKIVAKYNSVQNIISVENEGYMAWLRRLGFTFAPAVRIGRGLFRLFKYVRPA